jgi:arylsulfatase A
MRVALIAAGVGVQPGIVSRDLVDASDFLPTICDAAGVTIPKDLTIDGRSFLPQCRGETGMPREWIYCWYAPDGGKEADAEFAKDHAFKLYRDGRLFDVRDGDFNKKLVDRAKLDEAGKSAVAKLQAALDRYRDVRPARIVAVGGKGEKKPRAEFKGSK